jgi:hypothetical protein
VNYANETLIEGNRFLRGSGVKDIVITADATYTKIGPNNWIMGGTVAERIQDASNSTFYGFQINDEPVQKNNTSYTQLDESGVQRSMFRTTDDGTVYWYGYHGTPLARGGGGANYFYDGNGNIAAALSGAFSGLVNPDTYAAFAHVKATEVQADSYAVGATAGVDKTCTGTPTAMTVTKGIITAITCP